MLHKQSLQVLCTSFVYFQLQCKLWIYYKIFIYQTKTKYANDEADCVFITKQIMGLSTGQSTSVQEFYLQYFFWGNLNLLEVHFAKIYQYLCLILFINDVQYCTIVPIHINIQPRIPMSSSEGCLRCLKCFFVRNLRHVFVRVRVSHIEK